ncbi:MAG: hypothetical protein J1D85_07815 [Bacteroidales bacterium]|nr:hypothetical protein [Bacteroidales bacterium]
MKKIVLIITLTIVANIAKAQYPNPIVKRLSNQEVVECRTPAAVAYNFIESILCRDFERMLSLTDTEFTTNIIRWVNEDNLTHDLFFVRLFSAQGGEKLNILGWMPALVRNYEVAIAYVQDEWYYMDDDGSMCFRLDQVVKDGMIYIPGEDVPRAGINQKKVYVTCSPTSEVNYVGFQDITRYGDTNVKVLLEQVSGTWKVIGFK